MSPRRKFEWFWQHSRIGKWSSSIGSAATKVIQSGLAEAELHALTQQYQARHDRDREKLDRMIEYSQTAMCRWRKLVDYFGEEVDWESCGSCDNCLGVRS